MISYNTIIYAHGIESRVMRSQKNENKSNISMLDHVDRDSDGFWPQMRSRTHMSTCAFYDIETELSDLAVGDSSEHFDTCTSPSARARPTTTFTCWLQMKLASILQV